MAIHTNADSKLFISLTSASVDTINAMDDAAAVAFFESISDWVEVEELEDLGELGDTSEAITFTALNNARVRKLKTRAMPVSRRLPWVAIRSMMARRRSSRRKRPSSTSALLTTS